MIEQNFQGIDTFQFEQWAKNGRLQHAVFGRQGGVSQPPFASLNLSVSVADEAANVYENRRRAYGLFDRDTDSVVHAHLVHGNRVARVTSAHYGEWLPQVDGLITNEPDCALTMNYADCTPIFLYDPVQHAIGLGHAGWKGTVLDVAGEMVRQMTAEFGSVPADIMAGIGPCIGVGWYEVGEPVITAVRQAFAEPHSLLVPPPNGPVNGSDGSRPHFDLVEANWRNLRRAGVAQIERPFLCTATRTDRFFSHRAEQGKTGRFGTIMILQDKGHDG